MRLRRKNKRRELAAAIEHARGLIGDKKEEEALEFLEKSARDFPWAAEFPLLLAMVYREIRPDDIPAQLAKAAELGSDDPVIQVMVGHKWLNEGDVEKARVCASRAQNSIDEDFALMADLDRLIGRIAARDGDYALADSRLRSAVRREPDLPTHPLDLARFLWARGRDEDALAVIDESLGQVKEIDKGLLRSLRSEITSGI